LARRHPWGAIGIGLAAGFTLGAVAIPALRCAATEPADEPAGPRRDEAEETPPHDRRTRAARIGALGMVLEPLFEMAKVALTELLVSMVRRYTNPAPADTAPADTAPADTAPVDTATAYEPAADGQQP
jgi:hypothetical protein